MSGRSLPRWLLGACTVLVACATLPAPARASFGLKSFAASFEQAPLGEASEAPGPPDFQAGSHPYQFTASYAFNTTTNVRGGVEPEGSVKDVEVALPAGVAGNTGAVPQCPMAVFESGGLGANPCPDDTQIGVLEIDSPGLEKAVPLSNLAPPPGVAAQFGAVALAPVVIAGAIRNTAGEYQLVVEQHNLSQALPVLSVSVTLWGVPAAASHDSKRGKCLEEPGQVQGGCPSDAPAEPFLTMPTSCAQPLTTTITADSWEDPGAPVTRSASTLGAGGSPEGLAGCDRLAFDPTLTVQPESAAADAPTGLTAELGIPYVNTTAALATATLRDLALTLPAGMSINPATAGGLTACLPAQIGLGEASPPTCPNASKLGAFEIESPLVPSPLQGSMYVAQPAAGPFNGVLDFYLAGAADGLDLKLAGQLNAQASDGQLTLTLDGAPELPISHLRLTLYGGPRAALANPPACGAYAASATLTPYSAPESGPPAARASGFTIDEACGGGFAPTLAAGSTNSAAGRETGFTLQLARQDGHQYLHSFGVSLPPGLVANVNAVARCGEAEAATASCPQASEVGTIEISAGAGSAPYHLGGPVYLTGPYGGAPYGIEIVIPATAGPFDLGTVVVRGEIGIDLATASLTIATEPFPTILRGVPLRTKSVDLTIARHGFMVNPTSCASQTIGATVGSAAGTGVALSVPFQVAGCAGLAFAPTLTAAAEAPASRADGVGLDLAVKFPAGAQANTSSLTVELPRPLRARLTTIQHTCRAAVFAKSPALCPAGALVGTARAQATILPSPLAGPIYLVSGTGLLPRLVITMQGDGVTAQLRGAFHASRQGVTRAVFEGLPDVRLSSLEIKLPRGPHSVLGASVDVCTHTLAIGYAFIAHSGASVKHTTKLAVQHACRAPRHAGRLRAWSRGGAGR